LPSAKPINLIKFEPCSSRSPTVPSLDGSPGEKGPEECEVEGLPFKRGTWLNVCACAAQGCGRIPFRRKRAAEVFGGRLENRTPRSTLLDGSPGKSGKRFVPSQVPAWSGAKRRLEKLVHLICDRQGTHALGRRMSPLHGVGNSESREGPGRSPGTTGPGSKVTPSLASRPIGLII